MKPYQSIQSFMLNSNFRLKLGIFGSSIDTRIFSIFLKKRNLFKNYLRKKLNEIKKIYTNVCLFFPNYFIKKIRQKKTDFSDSTT